MEAAERESDEVEIDGGENAFCARWPASSSAKRYPRRPYLKRERQKTPVTTTSAPREIGEAGIDERLAHAVEQRRPKERQPVPERVVVVDAGLEPRDGEGDDIELERIERAGRRDGPAKLDRLAVALRTRPRASVARSLNANRAEHLRALRPAAGEQVAEPPAQRAGRRAAPAPAR